MAWDPLGSQAVLAVVPAASPPTNGMFSRPLNVTLSGEGIVTDPEVKGEGSGYGVGPSRP